MFVTMIAAKIRAYLRYRETVRELSRLTDRELDDLGLSRSEISFIARSHAPASRRWNEHRPAARAARWYARASSCRSCSDPSMIAARMCRVS